jgi:transcriptional regulator with XRE-family HTH domain
MPSKERAFDRGSRLARRMLTTIGDELRTARLMSGLTLEQVGRSAGMSYTTVGRIERAQHRSVTMVQLARLGAVVGLDVWLRAYPGPDAVRDAAQLGLLERFRARLHPALTLRTEVPLSFDEDGRAWDGMVAGFIDRSGEPLPAEVESRIHDVQAQMRRIQLKLRDSHLESMILIVADTRLNRDALRAAGTLLTALFPVPPRRALGALAAGRHPGGSALVFL